MNNSSCKNILITVYNQSEHFIWYKVALEAFHRQLYDIKFASQSVIVIALEGGQSGINWADCDYNRPEGQIIPICPTPNAIRC